MKNLFYIYGKKYRTDKVEHHEYHKIYNFFLKNYYSKDGCILEIGLLWGASLKMWIDLFPNAFIYGIDNGVQDSGERYKIFKTDQSKENELIKVKNELIGKGLFFINDDGSHIPEHQLLTFNVLFPLLEEGGIYIIEDVETSYWVRGGLYGYNTSYGYKHKNSIIEIFKDVADGVNSEFAGNRESKVQHLNSIGSITFSRNCIIIVKQTQEKRIYRFANKI